MKVYTRSTVAITVLAMCMALAGTAAAKGKKYGLFVGINNYPAPTNTLYGAVNDAKNMKSLLETKFAFLPANDVILTDQQATRAAILSNLASLGAKAGAGEPIDVGGADRAVAVHAGIAPAEIIGDEDHDVRPLRR